MREIHLGLPFRSFTRPSTGIVDVTICTQSGLLITPYCTHGRTTLPFLEGTQPVLFCDHHGNNRGRDIVIRHLQADTVLINPGDVLGSLAMPVIRDEQLLREFQQADQRAAQQAAQQARFNPRTPLRAQTPAPAASSLANPLLDDLPPLDFDLSLPDFFSDIGTVELPPLDFLDNDWSFPEETSEAFFDDGADFVVTPPLFNPLID